MKHGRLFIGVGLLGIVFAIVVWLMVRGSEFPQTDAKPPPASLLYKHAAGRPAPVAPVAVEEVVPAEKNGQLLLDMLTGLVPVPKPSTAAIENYLQNHDRGAANILAAWQVSGNPDYLREAATRFEGDPQVQFAILASDAFPDDRGKWIALFKQSSLYNPLANYYAAREYFRQNQTDQAVAEMVAASNKQGFDDYLAASFQDCEELFLATGVSPVDARARGFAAAFLARRPYVAAMEELGQQASSAQAAFAAAGDSASAQQLAQSGVACARQMNLGAGGRFLISRTIGISMEETFLKLFPPDEPLDWLGQTPAARLAELQQQNDQIEALQTTYTSALPQLSEAALSEYLDRVKQFGELEAMTWLASRVQNH